MYSYVKAVTAAVNKSEEYLSLARTLKDDAYWTSRAYGVLDSWRDETPKHFRMVFIRNLKASREI